MPCKIQDGHLLADILMSLVVFSLVVTSIFKHYATTSTLVRYLCTEQESLHDVVHVMELALYKHTQTTSQKNISVHYLPITPDAIQKKPDNYSFDFETDFDFVVVVTDSNIQKTNKRELKVVSGIKRTRK